MTTRTRSWLLCAHDSRGDAATASPIMATIRSGSQSDSTSPNQNTSVAAPRTESGTAFITDPIEVGAY